MAQRDARLIGGVYHTGSLLAKSGIVTTCTAHNRYTNDMVGLTLLDLPPALSTQGIQQALEPLKQRPSIHTEHIIQVFDWGIEAQRAYIVTTAPHGITLRYLMDNELIELPRTLQLMQQVLFGLQALHEHNITNLDLRPQFITVDTDEQIDHIQLDDLGLRILLKRLGYPQAELGMEIDSLDPRYAAPEHLQAGEIGPWSDTYQAGLLLFELLTGRLPFVGRDLNETAMLQCNSPVPRINQFAHDLPATLQTLLDKALAKQPSRRFASASEMLMALNNTIPKPLSGDKYTSEIPGVQVESASSPSGIDALLRARAISIPLPELPDAQGIYANLAYERANGEIQYIPILKTEAIIGRSDPKHEYRPDIDLTIFDTKHTVSRQHARISLKEGQFYLEDLGSRNKTRIDNITLPPKQAIPLRPGDHVRFGSVQLDFTIPAHMHSRK